ncbi:ankyrin repeat-containing protein [Microvirga lotononidis]|uniref:Ankyrin repeat-containing protein n=1 Tax=Microvirga lotononidis TaxID=864069 RepID=I4YS54_9HYPH|nr:ankyrin repeat-containing protein [Microvirga lotononidis]
MMMRLFFPVMVLGALLMSTFPGLGSTDSPPPLDRHLIAAAERGDVDAVRRALGEGASIDARDGRQRTALMAAVQSNQVAAARALIEAGADVNAKDEINDSPYLLAGARGYLEILRLTLAHGADLRSTNRYGGTALIPAAERGHVETVHTLIEAGVDVDHVNKLGWTALLEAIILGDGGPRHVEIVRLLLDADAEASLADRDGVTPLQHARQRGYREIEQLLTAAGAADHARRGGTRCPPAGIFSARSSIWLVTTSERADGRSVQFSSRTAPSLPRASTKSI